MPDISPAESIFFAALDREPADRRAFLDDACSGDADLRARIEKMLAAQPDLGDFLAPPTARPGETPAPAPAYPSLRELAGAVIAGKYELREQVGEGGMGVVWAADQRQPVTRRVAVKLIRGEHGGSAGVLARFGAERQAIARMDHPHVARLLDAGTTGEAEAATVGAGRPYFVMELVDGVPLNDYCDRHRLTVPDRLRLFVRICSAVQHAHQKGIVHRDLKPSNILVEHHDGRPVPRVIDFGLAKAVGWAVQPDQTLLTRPGTVTGTPLYMAPEQATFDAVDVDTRADVYALGVNLYVLLTGTTPIEREQFRKVPLHEVLRAVSDSDPPPPSRRVGSTDPAPGVAANRRTEPVKLGRLLRGELDWIVMKALAKERDRRYESATALAADVERFLNHEPVLAGPPSRVYRLGKFVRRNRVPVAAAAVVLLALLAGTAGTTFGLIRAEAGRGEAERAQRHEAAQRFRAEAARDRTWKALEAMTSWVTSEALGTQLALTDEQKRFLGEVLAYYQEFAAEQADDEATRARTAGAAHRVGAIELHLGRRPEAVAAVRAARDGYARLAADFPDVTEYRDSLAGAHNDLGLRLNELGKAEEAEEQIRTSLAIRAELAAAAPTLPAPRQHLAAGHNNLGVVLVARGKRPEAIDEYCKALAIQEKLAADFPDPEYRRDQARSHSNLSGQLVALGTVPAAEVHVRQAVTMQEKLAADDPTVPNHRAELAAYRGNLGVVLARLGKPAAAEAEYRTALAILEKLAAENPGVPGHRHELAGRHYNLGLLFAGQKKGPEAEEQYRKAIAIQEPLVVGYPSVPQYGRLLADARSYLGDLLVSRGKRPEAEEQFRKAIAARQKLPPQLSALPETRDRLAADLNALGSLLFASGKRTDGEAQFRAELGVRETLAADFPAVTRYQTELGGAACNFGGMLSDSGRPGEAVRWLDLAVRTLTATRARDQQSTVARDYLGNSHACRAITSDRLRNYGGALADWDRAIELDSNGGKAWLRAGRALSKMKAGRSTEAVAEAAELAKAQNWAADELCTLAAVFALASGQTADKREEYGARATELLRRAVRAGFRNAAELAADADFAPLRERDDFKNLLAGLRKE